MLWILWALQAFRLFVLLVLLVLGALYSELCTAHTPSTPSVCAASTAILYSQRSEYEMYYCRHSECTRGMKILLILGASVSTHKLGFTYENSIFGFWLGEAVLLRYSIYRCNEAQLEYIPYQVCDSVYHTPTVCFCWCSHLLTHRHNASPPSQHRFYSYYSNSGYTTQVAIILKP